MAIEPLMFNTSVTTLVNHTSTYYGDDDELETYVIRVRVKGPDIPGGSGLNWIVSPGGDERAPSLLRGVLNALKNGNGQNSWRGVPPGQLPVDGRALLAG